MLVVARAPSYHKSVSRWCSIVLQHDLTGSRSFLILFLSSSSDHEKKCEDYDAKVRWPSNQNTKSVLRSREVNYFIEDQK